MSKTIATKWHLEWKDDNDNEVLRTKDFYEWKDILAYFRKEKAFQKEHTKDDGTEIKCKIIETRVTEEIVDQFTFKY